MKRIRICLLLWFLSGYFLAVAQECGIIYVTPGGASSGTAGTKANPASLNYGLSLVSPADSILWLAYGTYPISNTLSIPGGVTIEGTFDPVTWIKSNVNTSTISRDALNPDLVNKALMAIEGNGISNFRLQDLNITVASTTDPQVSVYGIHLMGCSSYHITRCTITTGTGGGGTDGGPGANGLAGADGTDGVIGDDDAIITVCGGAGGAGAGAGAGAGGIGGCTDGNPGGAGGAPSIQCAGGGAGGGGGGGQNDNDGGNGGTGGGWSGANNAVGPKGLASGWCNSTSDCNDPTTGGPGSDGSNGATGAAGTIGAPGNNAAGYFIPGIAGASGQCGEGGQGGTGGGGGAGEGNIFCSNGTGATGAGAGGGGEGGQGGSGGTGGGGSFCIYLFSNGAGGIIQDCDLNPGAGGSGGSGGPGGMGGLGGFGGLGILWFNSDLGCSGDGGNGGAGGAGGAGGNGANGTSLQIYEHPGGVLVTQMGINQVPGNPPVISVDNPGCAFSEVIYSATSSGNWNFGAGATPATANGTGPFSVTYSTLGRKTVIFSGTAFTEYVHIFNMGQTGDFINPQDTTVILGCPVSFSSTLPGTYYEWWFDSGTNPDTIQGVSSVADSVYFNSPGVHTLILKITTGDSCCGVAFDTTTVTVDTSSFGVSITASLDTICQGDTMTFTGSGAYTNYEFFVNDTSVQNTPSNTFVTANLSPGDQIVVIALSGSCYTNPSDTLTPTILPVPYATLTSNDPDNTICSGNSITFTAVPSGYSSYDFLVNGVSQQAGSSNTFTTASLADGDSIMVNVPGLGCAGPSSNTILMNVDSPPVITLLSSDPDTTVCMGDSVVFSVTPSGLPVYAFMYNGVMVQSGSNNSYTALNISSGDQFFAAASGPSGCIGMTDSMYVTVNPIPVVTITSSTDTICLNDVITFIALPAGMDNYDFFVNGSPVQQGSLNSFTTSTLSDGDYVSVIATDLGCASAPDTGTAITVISGPSVTLLAAIDTICSGDTISVTATPSGYAGYEFYIGSMSVQNSASNVMSTAAVNNGDTLTVYATDFVCQGPQSNGVVVTVDIPAVTISSTDTTICDGDYVTISAQPSGNASYDFILNGSSVQSGSSNTYSSLSLADGDKIEVIPTSVNGCLGVTSNSIDFIVNPIPTVSITASDDTICLGDNMTFTALPAGMDSYIFSVGKTIVQIDSINAYSTTGIMDGDTVTVVAVDLGCVSIGTQIGPVTVISGPVVSLSSDDPDNTICAGDSITFTASPGGYLNYTFLVDGLPVQSGTDSVYGSATLPDGAVITAIASDLACPGPVATATAITVNPIPATLLLSSNDSICSGDSITFTAASSGLSNYTFFQNGISVQSGAVNTFTTNAINDGDVISVLPSDLGCAGTVTDSVQVTVHTLPVVGFESDTVCIGELSQFTVSSGSANIVNYVWDYGDGKTGGGVNGINNYMDTGTFIVLLNVTDVNGCSGSTSGIGRVNPQPSAGASAIPPESSILNPVISFLDTSDPPVPAGIFKWVWVLGDGYTDSVQNPVHTYADTGIYQVSLLVTNWYGCTDDILLTVKIKPEFTFHAPNSFTPNQDDLNETFIPLGIGLQRDFSMYIYDRWGDLIFETNSVSDPWDGTANDGKELAQEDVYVWIVFATDHDNARHKYVGHVTLIR